MPTIVINTVSFVVYSFQCVEISHQFIQLLVAQSLVEGRHSSSAFNDRPPYLFVGHGRAAGQSLPAEYPVQIGRLFQQVGMSLFVAFRTVHLVRVFTCADRLRVYSRLPV